MKLKASMIGAMLVGSLVAGLTGGAFAQPMMDQAGGGQPMMHGYGMGPGMMGPGMMGQGMMGHGMGGPGMMGLAALPDLTADQRAKIKKIQDETREKHWTLMGKIHDERFRLQDLYYADKRDKAAIDAEYKKLQDLQRQLWESQIETQMQIEALLTKEQKERLGRLGRGWMMCCM